MFATFSPVYAAAFADEKQPNALFGTPLDAWALTQDKPATRSGNGSDLSNLASQQVQSAATDALSGWLSRFGTTQLNLDIDEHFKLRGGSFDLLAPLTEIKQRLDFVQAGVRRYDGRTTLNLGLGQRYFLKDWMLGYNGFFDMELGRNHRRLGVGAEAWRDYLKLAVNGYARLSDWKSSTLVKDYDERSANGFDARIEGYLPFHPALGAKLAYEKYFGDQVDLFSRATRGPNQSAITLGLSYTPVPMFSFSVDRRQGSGQSDTRIGLQMNVQLDQPLRQQLDPSRMAERRSLAGSRHDLVNRNHRIVMEYREQVLLKVSLPAELKGAGKKVMPLSLSIETKKPIKNVVWQHEALEAAGGKIVDLGNQQYTVLMPAYQPDAINSYPVSVIAYDVEGRSSKPASMRVTVTGVDASAENSSLAVTPPSILANGADQSTLRLDLRDSDHQPVAGVAAQLQVALQETADEAYRTVAGQAATVGGFHETSPGVYEAALTAGTVPGTVTLATSINGQALGESQVQMTADTAAAKLAITADADTVAANGTAPHRVVATLQDPFGNPIKGTAITFTLGGSATVAQGSALEATTDAKGQAVVEVVDRVAEKVSVNIQAANGARGSIDLTFAADNASANIGHGDLTVDKTSMVANGADTVVYTAIVKDAQGNPASGLTVSWHTNIGNLSALTSTTDANGVAHISLTSTLAGVAQVTAQVGTQVTVNAPTVLASADGSTIGIGGNDLTVDKTTLIANGTDVVTYTAIVKDAHGNPVMGTAVEWATDAGTLSATSSTTNNAGVATINLTSLTTGVAQVTAKVDRQNPVNAQSVTMIGDGASAGIGNGDLIVDKTTIVANGTDLATYKATVKDAHGNPLHSVEVTWATSLGNLSALTSTTNGSGEASITLSGTVAGLAQVTAQLHLQAAVNAPPVTLEVDRASAGIGNGDLTVNKTTIIANGTDTAIYTAIVKDAHGNPVDNVTVTWRTDAGTLSGTSSTTNASGVATIGLTATVQGTANVTAQVGTQGAISARPVTITADTSTAQFVAFSTSKATITGNGAETSIISGRLVNGANQPLPNQIVTLTVTNGTLDSMNATTGSNGEFQVNLDAVNRTTSDVVSRVGASFFSANASANINVRAVQQVGGRSYWTLARGYTAATLAAAQSSCMSFGNGAVAAKADLQAFAAAGGDFARMNVPNEYQDWTYSLADSWGSTGGDFHGAGVGNTYAHVNDGVYVCVK